MKISHEGVWLDKPIVIPPCRASAGLCPKFRYTFGEGHVCGQSSVFHDGLHICKHCAMTFNTASCNNQEARDEWRGINGEKRG